ncbi:MAG TPA: molybdopterin-dependent oxidoreductase [Kineosporiaceae bacterium]
MGSGGVLPPGQRLVPALKVKHYGRVPQASPDRWTMVFTASGTHPADPPQELGRVTAAALAELPQRRTEVDLHCASGWTAQGIVWEGVPASALLELFPPPSGTVGVMAYAEYGYSTNVRVADLLQPTTLLATRLNGAALPPEHGFPVRLVVPHLYAHKSPKWFRGWEYLSVLRRGFWEERGYHLIGNPWAEERYSYLE